MTKILLVVVSNENSNGFKFTGLVIKAVIIFEHGRVIKAETQVGH